MLTSGVYIDPKILSEKTILEIYNRAIEHIRDGKTILSWQGEGTQASKQFTATPMEIAREARWALKSGWPHKYGFISQSARVYFA